MGEPVFGTRGTATDVLSIAVDSINTGSALVAVAAGAATCRRIVRGLVRDRKGSAPDELVLTVRDSKGERKLSVRRGDPAAEDQALDFLLASLPPQPPPS